MGQSNSRTLPSSSEAAAVADGVNRQREISQDAEFRQREKRYQENQLRIKQKKKPIAAKMYLPL